MPYVAPSNQPTSRPSFSEGGDFLDKDVCLRPFVFPNQSQIRYEVEVVEALPSSKITIFHSNHNFQQTIEGSMCHFGCL
jgi:hypothetical protein